MNKETRGFQRNFNLPGAGCVRVGPIAAIPDLLRAHARETPAQIFAEIGIDLTLFDDPDNTISFVEGGQLLDLCAKRTGIPHFGLLAGQVLTPDTLGPLSAFALHSPDVGSALHNIILHLCIHDRGGIPTLTTNKGTATFGYAIYLAMQEGASQVHMCSMAVVVSLMRALCGETWAPSQVLFTHAQPDDIKPYTSLFNVKPVFNSHMNAMIFADHWLQQSIPGADPQQYRALVEELTVIKSEIDTDFLELVRSLMCPLVISGRCSETKLAQVLSLHPRTLNRRLKERQTTFRSLIADTRYEISKQLLEESDTSILGISTILGYADASVFTRAFRRWSGVTPNSWRTQNLETPGHPYSGHSGETKS